MREIKFRGKAIDHGKHHGSMVYGNLSVDESGTWIDCGTEQESEWVPVDPATVGQFIGFVDRDDRKIYQGDIVAVDCDCDPGYYGTCSHAPNLNIVIWDQTEASFSFRGIMFRADDMHADYTDMWDVVGNVYENPELLAPKEGADKRE
ncbi:YopX family protein [Paenibacillus xylanexedens]|uniref:YopX family protein n=1 Tax=Paenibacillus xylanexedens TaxID=528191 RepID=UPI0011A12836|nr:YopX family protein [Paenibacillus xylanexedens]